MARYTVVWVQSAEDELVDLWLASGDRADISAAVNSIDEALCSDAETKGHALAEELRSFNAPPIRVLFSVRSDDRVAEILSVRRV